MSRALALPNLLLRKVRGACVRYLDGQLVSATFGPQLADGYWRALIEEAGVELERVIRVRGDTRGVFVVRHPAWGRCVLKTVLAARRPRVGLSNLWIAESVRASRPPLFPEIYEATADYTLEQYVDGRKLRAWAKDDFALEPVAEYLSHLRDWSRQPYAGLSGPTLRADEVRDLCRTHLEQCVYRGRYATTENALKVAFAAAGGSRLKAEIEWLWDEAGRVRLPRTVMCGDMWAENLLVQTGTDRVFNIDYETLGPGHWGFDCAYLVSSLAKKGDCGPAVSQVRQVVFDGEYLGGEEATRFFSVLADVLAEISRTLYGAAEPARAPSVARAPGLPGEG